MRGEGGREGGDLIEHVREKRRDRSKREEIQLLCVREGGDPTAVCVCVYVREGEKEHVNVYLKYILLLDVYVR